MTPYSANPFASIFSALILFVFVLYAAYFAINSVGLATEMVDATITGKHYNPGGTSFRTNIAGGRAWTQSYDTPDSYVVSLDVGGEATVGLVSKEIYETLKTYDRVKAVIRRTRITKRLEVIELKN